jgi:hypothetical protein
MDDRHAAARAFADGSGWAGAVMRPLAGDASARRYWRLSRPGGTAVLMDAPPGQGDDIASFSRIAGHLAALGLSPPRILAADPAGFLLIEDLGDDLFARLLARAPGLEAPLYRVAADVLAVIEAAPAPFDLPDPGAADWAAAAAPVIDWYRFALTGRRDGADELTGALAETLAAHADGPRVLILRDYHAENLLWLPDRPAAARVGLLDFQLAQMGQPGYDLVSLCQDARRDLGPGIEPIAIRHYLETTGRAAGGFDAAYAALGAQRALRILGVFARLCLVAGKPGYVDLMPRVWGHLRANLRSPALARLAVICDRWLPEPTPERLRRIAQQCGRHSP